MISKELKTINGKEFIETKSDTYKIIKVGTNEIYGSAIDIYPTAFVYEETVELLDTKNEELLKKE